MRRRGIKESKYPSEFLWHRLLILKSYRCHRSQIHCGKAQCYSQSEYSTIRSSSNSSWTIPIRHKNQLVNADKKGKKYRTKENPINPERTKVCGPSSRWVRGCSWFNLCGLKQRSLWLFVRGFKKDRRLLTLPHSYPCSTISGAGLNCSVRNGKRCITRPIATVNVSVNLYSKGCEEQSGTPVRKCTVFDASPSHTDAQLQEHNRNMHTSATIG